MRATFDAEVFFWRGPSPWHFVAVPEDVAAEIHDISSDVTYGWGMIPATVAVGGSRFTTALWPKEGGYIVPLKTTARRAERIDIGDRITVQVSIGE